MAKATETQGQSEVTAPRTLSAADALLVRLLALRDACFAVVRRFDSNLSAAAFLARRDYEGTGVPWNSDQQTEDKRKATQRALESLGASGMLVTIRAGVRAVGAKLTDTGERRACLITAQFVMGDGVGLLAAIQHREAAGIAQVPEDDLIATLPAWAGNQRHDRKIALMMVSDLALPFLVRGILTVGSTVKGNARYGLGPTPAPADLGPGVHGEGASELARRVYVSMFDRERGRLSGTPTEQEIGPAPLSVGALSQAELDGWTKSAEMAATGE